MKFLSFTTVPKRTLAGPSDTVDVFRLTFSLVCQVCSLLTVESGYIILDSSLFKSFLLRGNLLAIKGPVTELPELKASIPRASLW